MAQLPFFIYYKLHIKNYMLHNYYVVTRQHNRTHACKVAIRRVCTSVRVSATVGAGAVFINTRVCIAGAIRGQTGARA